MKATFEQLEIGHSFVAGDTTYVKLRDQKQGNYGRINAQGPPQYLQDEGYRFFYEDQAVEVVAAQPEQVERVSDLAALHNILADIEAMTGRFDAGTMENHDLERALHLVAGVIAHVATGG